MMSALASWLSTENLLKLSMLILPRAGAMVGIGLGAWLLMRILEGAIGRVGKSRQLNNELVELFEKTMKLGICILAGLTILGTLGIDVSALVTGLGLTGFAIGLALKDILSNLIAGVLTLLYRPFKRKDWVTVAGFEGNVVNIDLRYTTLKTSDKTILIPNSTLINHAIIVHERKPDLPHGTPQNPHGSLPSPQNPFSPFEGGGTPPPVSFP